MDAVYIERSDQSNAAYGGITQIDVADKQIIIYLSQETAKSLDTDTMIDIDISLANSKNVNLYAGLQQLCEGSITLIAHN